MRAELDGYGSFISMLERNRSISYPEMSSDIGIYGLTSQGISFALNIASKGYNVTVGNKSSDKVLSSQMRIDLFVDKRVHRTGRERRFGREDSWNQGCKWLLEDRC